MIVSEHKNFNCIVFSYNNTDFDSTITKTQAHKCLPAIFSGEMTSTNDEKDIKSNQTSGQKGKSYYIELYKVSFILFTWKIFEYNPTPLWS